MSVLIICLVYAGERIRNHTNKSQSSSSQAAKGEWEDENRHKGYTVSLPHAKQTKVDGKVKANIKTADKELPPTTKEMGSSSADLVCLSSAQPEVPTWYHTARYNPLTEELQRRVCRQLGLNFVCTNRCTPGGPNVALRYPTSVHRI